MKNFARNIAARTLDLATRASQHEEVRNWREQCSLDNPDCDLSLSYWAYLPSLPANAFFAAIFGFSTLLFIIQGTVSRRFLGFTIAMTSGCITEVIGYAGRLLSHQNPFKESAFLIQIVCLTIGPAFLAAGIYLCLSRIVLTFGSENSRIKPLSYPRIFIPCDLASLLLQAVGGGIASAASHSDKDPTVGNNIMIAGLAVQVATLLIFILLSVDFALRVLRRHRELGTAALDPTHARLRASWAFKGFLAALVLATLCIFTRSVYRVAELSQGWQGHLIKTQKYFIGLEGAIIGVAVLVLNAFHPELCFREGWVEDAGKSGSGCFGCFGRFKKTDSVGRSSGHEAVLENK